MLPRFRLENIEPRVEETAEALKVSPQSVMRDWKMARAWLMQQLTR